MADAFGAVGNDQDAVGVRGGDGDQVAPSGPGSFEPELRGRQAGADRETSA